MLECAIQATNGPHRDDSNLMVQNDVTHSIPGLHTDALPVQAWATSFAPSM